MQRRGVLIGVVAVLGLCVLGCALVFIAGIPAFRGQVRDGVRDAVATEVALRIPPASLPGRYVLTEADLQASLRANFDDDANGSDDEALIVRITVERLEIGVTSGGQDAIYTGVPVAEDGRLVMRDMETDNDVVSFLLPPDDVGGAIEEAVNDHLAANGLALDAVELDDGALTLVVRAV